MDKKKKITACLLMAVIIIVGAYMIINWNDLFTSKTVIDFSDGCREEYINGKLVTPECTASRVAEQIIIDSKWNSNPSIT